MVMRPGALRHVVQPVQQMHQRALAGAGAAQHGEGLSLPDGEGHVLQDRLPLVAEGHMVKHNVPAGEGNVIGLILLLRGAEDVAHTVHGYPGLAHIRQHPAQRTHGHARDSL